MSQNTSSSECRDVTVATFDWAIDNFRHRLANEKFFDGTHFVFMNSRFRWSAVQTPAPDPERRIMLNNLVTIFTFSIFGSSCFIKPAQPNLT